MTKRLHVNVGKLVYLMARISIGDGFETGLRRYFEEIDVVLDASTLLPCVPNGAVLFASENISKTAPPVVSKS